MIQAENIVKVYPNGVKALEGVSFLIEHGEICAYLGGNGAGKSTTAKILCGMLGLTSGEVFVNGINTAVKPDDVKKITGYVPESGALFLSMTPYDFLEFVCRMYDLERKLYNHRIYSFMEMFDLKTEVNTPMHAFSKGMRQKVLIISSLIHDPDVVIWDEPFSGIDYNTTMVIRGLVKELAASGKTFFYSTHVIESVDRICTRAIILNKGKVVYDGSLAGTDRTGLEELMKKYSAPEQAQETLTGLYNNKPAI